MGSTAPISMVGPGIGASVGAAIAVTAAVVVAADEAVGGATVTVQGGTNGFKVSARSFITIGVFTVTDTTGIGIDLKDSSSIVLVANRVAVLGRTPAPRIG